MTISPTLGGPGRTKIAPTGVAYALTKGQKALSAPTQRDPKETRHLAEQTPFYRVYVAWDLPTRLFHWVNALAVIGLVGNRNTRF